MSDSSKDKYFVPENLTGTPSNFSSPSGKWNLSVQSYKTGDGYWNYTRGIVTELPSGKEVSDIKRNYSSFWHLFVEHPNGHEYLLCGEDYQGYTVLDLTMNTIKSYLPESAQHGAGFCWVEAQFLSEEQELRVEGCYWAAPFEIVYYDFHNPEELPLLELRREWDESDGEEGE